MSRTGKEAKLQLWFLFITALIQEDNSKIIENSFSFRDKSGHFRKEKDVNEWYNQRIHQNRIGASATSNTNVLVPLQNVNHLLVCVRFWDLRSNLGIQIC